MDQMMIFRKIPYLYLGILPMLTESIYCPTVEDVNILIFVITMIYGRRHDPSTLLRSSVLTERLSVRNYSRGTPVVLLSITPRKWGRTREHFISSSQLRVLLYSTTYVLQ